MTYSIATGKLIKILPVDYLMTQENVQDALLKKMLQSSMHNIILTVF